MTLSITRTDTVLDAENSSEQNIAPVTKISPYIPRRDKQKINRKHAREVYQINDRGRARKKNTVYGSVYAETREALTEETGRHVSRDPEEARTSHLDMREKNTAGRTQRVQRPAGRT